MGNLGFHRSEGLKVKESKHAEGVVQKVPTDLFHSVIRQINMFFIPAMFSKYISKTNEYPVFFFSFCILLETTINNNTISKRFVKRQVLGRRAQEDQLELGNQLKFYWRYL